MRRSISNLEQLLAEILAFKESKQGLGCFLESHLYIFCMGEFSFSDPTLYVSDGFCA